MDQRDESQNGEGGIRVVSSVSFGNFYMHSSTLRRRVFEDS